MKIKELIAEDLETDNHTYAVYLKSTDDGLKSTYHNGVSTNTDDPHAVMPGREIDAIARISSIHLSAYSDGLYLYIEINTRENGLVEFELEPGQYTLELEGVDE